MQNQPFEKIENFTQSNSFAHLFNIVLNMKILVDLKRITRRKLMAIRLISLTKELNVEEKTWQQKVFEKTDISDFIFLCR